MKGTRVLVMGMGRSGTASAQYAVARGASVHCTDLRENAPVIDGCTHRYGEHQRSDFLDADTIIVSPGVPASQADLIAAKEAGVNVVSELGWSAAQVQDRNIPIIAVTGTNGKSSVTHFVGQLLRNAGRDPFVGGNIGRPLTELLSSTADVAVVEVSSYQLELPGKLQPIAAAILNLSPDHLARHGDMDGYARAKIRLFQNMTPSGYALVPSAGSSNPNGRLHHGDTHATRMYLGETPGVRRDGPVLTLSDTPDDGEVDLAGLTLLGEHNLDNAAAAVALCVCAGVPRSAIDVGCITALPHRLEPVHAHGGVTWVNDSKATNVDAALVGIKGISRSLIVLLGGQGKAGADYEKLRPALAACARQIICFGSAGNTISEALDGLPVSSVGSLQEAVVLAARSARSPDVVLLSPACASFDEFDNFEERGTAFAALAQEATQ